MAKRLQFLKRFAALPVAIFAISLSVNAQIWYIYGEYTWSAPHPVGTFHEYHFSDEIVEIDGLQYITLYVDSEVNDLYLDGAYRNDGNQVYYRKWNGTSLDDEFLLYDYDLEEGDFFNDDNEHPM